MKKPPFIKKRQPGPRPVAGHVREPLKPATHWDPVADWYDQLVGDQGSEYHQQVVHPGVLRLLKPSLAERILDLSCGQGVLCRLLRQRGAVVVGVDASAKLIEAARMRQAEEEVEQGAGSREPFPVEFTRQGGSSQLPQAASPKSPPPLQYLLGDARQLRQVKGLGGGTFDAVTHVLAIQNIDPIEPVFEGVSWLLRPGGRLVMVMMHPAFRSPQHTSWGFEGHDFQYRRIDRYLLPRKHPIVSHPGHKDSGHTWTFHRPLQSYVHALSKAGLLVDAIEEWPSHKESQPGPRASAENAARREIPLFMAIRAVKA